MIRKLQAFGLGAFILGTVFVACDNKALPTSSDRAPEPQPQSATPAPTSSNPSPTSGATDTPNEPGSSVPGFNASQWAAGNTKISVTLSNSSGHDEPISFACYEAPNGVNDLDAQKLFSEVNDILSSGESKRYTIDLPQCVWQCDALKLAKARAKPRYHPLELIGFRDSEQLGRDLPLKCAPPPPPPPPPPPSCDLVKLTNEATQECGAENFTLDEKACTFECNPPPICEELYDVETDIEGSSAVIRLKNTQGQTVATLFKDLTLETQSGEICVGQGQESIVSNGETCCLPWELPPREPTCEEDPPDPFGTTTGSVSITKNDDGTWNAEASLDYTVSGAPGEYKIEIFWVNGNQSHVKEDKVVTLECGGEKTGSLRWVSNNRDCDHGHVNPGAMYFQRVFYREDEQDSWSNIEEEKIGEGSATCPEECVLPQEGVYDLTTGSEDVECGQFGFDGIHKESSWPWDLPDGDFYLIKCGTQYELTLEKPSKFGTTCSLATEPGPKIHGRSHISVCECKLPD